MRVRPATVALLAALASERAEAFGFRAGRGSSAATATGTGTGTGTGTRHRPAESSTTALCSGVAPFGPESRVVYHYDVRLPNGQELLNLPGRALKCVQARGSDEHIAIGSPVEVASFHPMGGGAAFAAAGGRGKGNQNRSGVITKVKVGRPDGFETVASDDADGARSAGAAFAAPAAPARVPPPAQPAAPAAPSSAARAAASGAPKLSTGSPPAGPWGGAKAAAWPALAQVDGDGVRTEPPPIVVEPRRLASAASLEPGAPAETAAAAAPSPDRATGPPRPDRVPAAPAAPRGRRKEAVRPLWYPDGMAAPSGPWKDPKPSWPARTFVDGRDRTPPPVVEPRRLHAAPVASTETSAEPASSSDSAPADRTLPPDGAAAPPLGLRASPKPSWPDRVYIDGGDRSPPPVVEPRRLRAAPAETNVEPALRSDSVAAPSQPSAGTGAESSTGSGLNPRGGAAPPSKPEWAGDVVVPAELLEAVEGLAPSRVAAAGSTRTAMIQTRHLLCDDSLRP